METYQFAIPADQLKALALCSAKRDVRYYLQGVAFDFTGKYPVAVSTDGHRALVVKLEIEPDLLPPAEYRDEALIVPLESIAALKTRKGSDVTVSLDKANGQFSLASNGGIAIQGKFVDGKYPDWRRVLPQSISGEAGAYNPTYVGDFGKISKLFGASYPSWGYNGNGPALIGITDNAIGVLMPMRREGPAPSVPHWV